MIHQASEYLSHSVHTSCIKLKRWEEATRFAQNSLILLDALNAKKGLKIHSILNKEGIIDAKLFGEWRVKSYLVIARSFLERDDEEGALAVLKRAKLVAMENIEDINSKQQSNVNKQELDSLKILTSQIKEVRRLMADCTEKIKDRPTIKKSVSFSLKPPQIKEFDSSTGDEDLPWYSRHKEALAMVAIAGFSVVAIASLRKLQRAS